jgi:hypothetical protein
VAFSRPSSSPAWPATATVLSGRGSEIHHSDAAAVKEPHHADEAFHKTQATLDKLDNFIEKRDWTYLGDKAETKKAMKRMGDAVGGFKGFLIRNFYQTGL